MTKIIRILTAVCAWLTAMVAVAAQPDDSTAATGARLVARNCFTAAPKDVLPLLEPQTRQDMLSYYDAGRDTPSKNTFGHDCRIIALDDDRLEMETGSGIVTEMFVLNPDGKNQVIGVIETVLTPVPDSRVSFYDTKWRSIDKKMGVDPTLADWLPKSVRRDIADIRREVPFVLSTMQYDPATLTLTARNNMSAYYPGDGAPAVLSALRPTLTYRWTGKKFRLVN